MMIIHIVTIIMSTLIIITIIILILLLIMIILIIIILLLIVIMMKWLALIIIVMMIISAARPEDFAEHIASALRGLSEALPRAMPLITCPLLHISSHQARPSSAWPCHFLSLRAVLNGST